MNKTVFKVAKWFVLIMFIISAMIFLINSKRDENEWIIDNLNMKLTFSEGYITCEEELLVTVGKDCDRYYHLQGNTYSFITGKVEITYKDKQINDRLTGAYFQMLQSTANELGATAGEQIKIKFLYKIESNVIQRYRGMDTLGLRLIDAKNLKVILVPYTTITDVYAQKANVVENNGTYEINFGDVKSSEIKIEGKFNDVQATEYYNHEETTSIDYLKWSAIITFICLIIVLINNKKKKKVNEYRRDFKDLISPCLAELIIDGKIDMKNLIMATIIDLELKGKAKIINNNEIRLISTEDLDGVQKCIVQLLFEYERKTIKLSDINEIFLKSNEKTKRFSENLKEVKAVIINILTATKYISTNRMKINRVLKVIAILNCIMIFFLFTGTNIATDIIPVLLATGIVATCITFRMDQGVSLSTNNNSVGGVVLSFLVIAGIATFYLVKINLLLHGWEYLLVAILVVLGNIIIIKKSQNVILSEVGEEMRIELLKLKKYLKDYSIINERELESVTIWDAYLAYATAFGMPNNIIKQIYESWYNINMTIQMVSTIL